MDKGELKQKIEAEIANLDASIPGLRESARPVELDQSSVGRLSRMDAIAAQAVNKRSLTSAETKLIHLKQALLKVDNEEFGQCAECDEPINPKRILAVPESPHCIKCAQSKGS